MLTIVGGTHAVNTSFAISRKNVFQEFLALEIDPGLTLEEASCPMCFSYSDDSPPSEELRRRFRLLMASGASYIEVSLDYPGYLTISDPKGFAKRFPHFKEHIPFIVECGGVWVYDDASPVKRPGLRKVEPVEVKSKRKRKDLH